MNHLGVGKPRAGVAAIVVAVMVGAAAAGVAAQQASPTRQGDRPSLAGRWFGVGPRAMAVGLALRALDLTEAQRDSIAGVMQAHRDEFKDIARAAMGARRALDDAVTAETTDPEVIRAAAARVAEADLAAALLRAKVHAEVFAVLTAEQRLKATTMREKAWSRVARAIERRLGS
jgi:Spy/CpxP family protein refolding chaperone